MKSKKWLHYRVGNFKLNNNIIFNEISCIVWGAKNVCKSFSCNVKVKKLFPRNFRLKYSKLKLLRGIICQLIKKGIQENNNSDNHEIM